MKAYNFKVVSESGDLISKHYSKEAAFAVCFKKCFKGSRVIDIKTGIVLVIS